MSADAFDALALRIWAERISALEQELVKVTTDRDMWLREASRYKDVISRQIARTESAERRLAEVAASERERCASMVDANVHMFATPAACKSLSDSIRAIGAGE